MTDEMKAKGFTEAGLSAAVAALGDVDDDTKKAVACALVGHSRIQTFCFGYWYCGRCGVQIGDSLGSIYPAANQAVVVGHDCDACRENAKTLTWRDTYLAADPFPVADDKG